MQVPSAETQEIIGQFLDLTGQELTDALQKYYFALSDERDIHLFVQEMCEIYRIDAWLCNKESQVLQVLDENRFLAAELDDSYALTDIRSMTYLLKVLKKAVERKGRLVMY